MTGASATLAVTTNNVTTNVTVPPGALEGGTQVQVAPITNMAQLEDLGGLPANTDIVAGVQINATSADGHAVTGNFPAPVTVSFSVAASAMPVGATPETLTVAYWTGSSWSQVEGTVSKNADGSYSITASVKHFTTFGVLHDPNRTLFVGAKPVFSASGFALAVFGGGSSSQLEAAATRQGASGVWIQNARGEFHLLVVNGPAFLRTQFDAQFPTGVANSSSVTLTRPAR